MRSKKNNLSTYALVFYACSMLLCLQVRAKEQSSEDAFTNIYENGMWGYNEDGSPSSGWGSSYEHSKIYIDFINQFLRENEIRTVIDIGCGDWNISKYIDWGDVQYIGVDVVKKVVERNVELYSESNIHFIHADMLKIDNWESCGLVADLLICKDVLHHIKNKDIMRFLSKIKPFTHCLITNDVLMYNVKVNSDISNRGLNRPIDLSKPPFNVIGTAVLEYSLGEYTKQVFYINNTN